MAVAKAAYERGKEELKHNKPTVSSYFKGGKQALFNSAVAFFLLALAVRGYSEKVLGSRAGVPVHEYSWRGVVCHVHVCVFMCVRVARGVSSKWL